MGATVASAVFSRVVGDKCKQSPRGRSIVVGVEGVPYGFFYSVVDQWGLPLWRLGRTDY